MMMFVCSILALSPTLLSRGSIYYLPISLPISFSVPLCSFLLPDYKVVSKPRLLCPCVLYIHHVYVCLYCVLYRSSSSPRHPYKFDFHSYYLQYSLPRLPHPTSSHHHITSQFPSSTVVLVEMKDLA
eukprot:TRINITY_DN21188_c0_g1::TRINITY_DN21188_c0_g1_i1::g.30112::m.30112 TRINITY_DN21188_c0_g1::TRINITY_DN21188_c0_g1_i1::g.30112  ORF type:complete len:127 (-),score=-6.21,FeThRed_B/PF02943.10/0.17 TRINITY_DN21188_c0_g1_i1:40-420(-)